MRANFVMSGIAAGIRRNLGMTVALILSTSIALAFVGASILANKEITKFRSKYVNNLNVSVYLCPTPTPAITPTPDAATQCPAQTSAAQTTAIKTKLEADPNVISVTYVSEQQAYDIGKALETPAELRAGALAFGVLPASFTVKLKSYAKPDYDSFAATFSAEPGVGQVTNAIDTINALLNIIDSARIFSIVLAALVLVASILLMANTIQVAAAQRKNETSIMRLVGASRWMTELPFMLEAMIASAVGGVIAFAFVWLGKNYVLNNVFHGPTERGVIPNLTINDVLVAGGIGLIIGIVLAALTAFVTLRLRVKL